MASNHQGGRAKRSMQFATVNYILTMMLPMGPCSPSP